MSKTKSTRSKEALVNDLVEFQIARHLVDSPHAEDMGHGPAQAQKDRIERNVRALADTKTHAEIVKFCEGRGIRTTV